MQTKTFKEAFQKEYEETIKFTGGGLNFPSWGGRKCNNANDLPVGIRTKAGSDCKAGYPAGTGSDWGLLVTTSMGNDFTQIFIMYNGRTVYMRGGMQDNVTNVPWYKYSPAAETVAPAE